MSILEQIKLPDLITEVKDLDFQPFNLYTKGYNESTDAAWWIARIREDKHVYPQINKIYK